MRELVTKTNKNVRHKNFTFVKTAHLFQSSQDNFEVKLEIELTTTTDDKLQRFNDELLLRTKAKSQSVLCDVIVIQHFTALFHTVLAIKTKYF